MTPCVDNPEPFNKTIERKIGPEYQAAATVAKSLYLGCHRIRDCLHEAMTTPLRHEAGVIGGTTFDERHSKRGYCEWCDGTMRINTRNPHRRFCSDRCWAGWKNAGCPDKEVAA